MTFLRGQRRSSPGFNMAGYLSHVVPKHKYMTYRFGVFIFVLIKNVSDIKTTMNANTLYKCLP